MSYNLQEKQARMKLAAKVEHTEKMLEDAYEEYAGLITEGTLERNLNDARVGKDPKGNIENELAGKTKGSKRTDTKAKTTEERLNEAGTRQNVKGDIPKLEEQRLSKSPVEKETSKKATD